jgi:hypothetical protein
VDTPIRNVRWLQNVSYYDRGGRRRNWEKEQRDEEIKQKKKKDMG